MTGEDKTKRIFAKNLKRILLERDKTPADLNRDLKIPFSTISNWTTGKKMPRMGAVELLADYLSCKKSDLLEEQALSADCTKEIDQIAKDICDNSDMMFIYEMSRKMKPERFQKYVRLLKDFEDIE